MNSKVLFFHCNSNKRLAEGIAQHLSSLGLLRDHEPSRCEWLTFPNKSECPIIREKVEDQDVFILASLADEKGLWRLLNLLYVCRDRRARKITVLFSKLFGDRQDRSDEIGKPSQIEIVGRMVGDYADHVIITDAHSNMARSAFSKRKIIPTDQLFALRVLVTKAQEYMFASGLKNEDIAVVAVDEGGQKIMSKYSSLTGFGKIQGFKERVNPDEAKLVDLMGNVEKHTGFIIIDDMVTTGGSISNVGVEIKRRKKDAKSMIVTATTHPDYANCDETALAKLDAAPFDRMYFGDTMDVPADKRIDGKIEIVSLAGFFAHAINLCSKGQDFKPLFDYPYKGFH